MRPDHGYRDTLGWPCVTFERTMRCMSGTSEWGQTIATSYKTVEGSSKGASRWSKLARVLWTTGNTTVNEWSSTKGAMADGPCVDVLLVVSQRKYEKAKRTNSQRYNKDICKIVMWWWFYEWGLHSGLAMSMSSNVAHAQSTNPWGSSSTSSLSSSLTDTFGQSRTHYQPGYMMVSHPNQSPLFFTDPPSQSAQQHHVHAPQNAQHADEIPTVQTKAKMNLALSRGGAPHFGADSMFESASTSVPFFCSRQPLSFSSFMQATAGICRYGCTSHHVHT